MSNILISTISSYDVVNPTFTQKTLNLPKILKILFVIMTMIKSGLVCTPDRAPWPINWYLRDHHDRYLTDNLDRYLTDHLDRYLTDHLDRYLTDSLDRTRLLLFQKVECNGGPIFKVVFKS